MADPRAQSDVSGTASKRLRQLRPCVHACLVACLLVQATAAGQSPAPLPDPNPFYEAVRQNLTRAQRQQNRYAYRERRTELHTNPFGRIGTGGTRVYDVVPTADGSALMRQLIERDDVPVPNGPVERVSLQRRQRPATGQGLDEVAATLTFQIDRREMLDGHSTIVVTFAPRPDAKPRTREGRMARIFKGTIWVNEAAQEVEKVEAIAIDNMSFGLGIVARLNEGARVRVARQPVADGLWLPTSVQVLGAGRALLFRKLNVDYAVEWSNYRRVSE